MVGGLESTLNNVLHDRRWSVLTTAVLGAKQKGVDLRRRRDGVRGKAEAGAALAGSHSAPPTHQGRAQSGAHPGAWLCALSPI
jgi:hypothetical protein